MRNMCAMNLTYSCDKTNCNDFEKKALENEGKISDQRRTKQNTVLLM